VFDRIGEAFEAFKKAHDEEVKGIKKGFADVVTTDKLNKIKEALDKGVEAKAALDAAIEAEKKHVDEIEKKLNKLGLSNTDEGRKRELELKSSTRCSPASPPSASDQFTPLDQKGYDEYKAAARNHFMREGKEKPRQDEVKTLSVGSDPDGGYFVTPDISGRIVKKVFETSPVRQFATTQPISTDALEGIEDTRRSRRRLCRRARAGLRRYHHAAGRQVADPGVQPSTPSRRRPSTCSTTPVDVEGWLGGKVGDKIGRFENAEFVTGAERQQDPRLHGAATPSPLIPAPA
jgi:predicted phage gp36 major capsid-like protein